MSHGLVTLHLVTHSDAHRWSHTHVLGRARHVRMPIWSHEHLTCAIIPQALSTVTKTMLNHRKHQIPDTLKHVGLKDRSQEAGLKYRSFQAQTILSLSLRPHTRLHSVWNCGMHRSTRTGPHVVTCHSPGTTFQKAPFKYSCSSQCSLWGRDLVPVHLCTLAPPLSTR